MWSPWATLLAADFTEEEIEAMLQRLLFAAKADRGTALHDIRKDVRTAFSQLLGSRIRPGGEVVWTPELDATLTAAVGE
eukprot:3070354-Prymnesium_polylepis.1